MPRAWLTPDSAPGAVTCRPIFLPDGLEYQSAFYGAFLLLTQVFNWEKHGEQTPEDVSDAFYEAFIQTVAGWGACEVSGFIVGEIRAVIHSFPSALTGWLACDGTAYNIADYENLYENIGNTFGDNGAGTFRVPDLRGRMVIGTGSGSGLTPRAAGDAGGAETHVLSVAELPAHHHIYQKEPTAAQSGAGQAGLHITGATANANTSDTGSGGAHQNMPPFLAIPYFIYAGSGS